MNRNGNDKASKQARAWFPGPGAYPLLDLDFCTARGLAPEALPELWRSVGVRYFQLRAKSLAEAEYVDLARRLRARHPDLRIIANDLAAAALASAEAEDGLFAGLHLGQEDFAALAPALRGRLVEILADPNADFAAGCSAHEGAQLRAALAGDDQPAWSYVALGPCYATENKTRAPRRNPELGPEGLAQAVRTAWEALQARERTILVLIGGITASNLPPLLVRLDEELAWGGAVRPLPAAIAAAAEERELRWILAEMRRYID